MRALVHAILSAGEVIAIEVASQSLGLLITGLLVLAFGLLSGCLLYVFL